MQYQQQIKEYFAKHRDEMVEDICRLVRIRSVGEDARPGMPYGPGPAAALDEAMKMAADMGFATKNYDNYVGTVDMNGSETQLAMLAHLDVVHEGTGWTVTLWARHRRRQGPRRGVPLCHEGRARFGDPPAQKCAADFGHG